MRNLNILLVCVLLESGCSSQVAPSEHLAVEISDRHLDTVLPEMKISERVISQTDNGWIITYLAEEEALGGKVTIVVHKRSGDVVALIGEQ